MRRLVWLALCSTTVFSSTAQTDVADSLSAASHLLHEVTVVQSRQTRTVASTVPLHILGREEMLQSGVTDMADALHRLPGITLRDYGGAGGMKTVSVRGFGAKHTGISYDGIMLSDCQSGEIDLSRYSLDHVESLSLVVGDNDDIFIPARQAAVPAALSIQTMAAPTDSALARLTAQLRVGSFGYVSPFVRYEQPLSPRFSISAVGSYTYADNDYPYTVQNVNEQVSDRRTNSRMNSGFGELNLVWAPSPLSRLSGKVYYYDNDRQLPGQVRYYTNVSRETLHDRNLFAQFTCLTRWDAQWSLKVNGKFNWASSSYRDPLYQGGVMDADYWQREAYAAAALLWNPSDRWAFDYSADYAFNNLNSSLSTDTHPYRHSLLQSLTAKYTSQRLTAIGRLLCSLYLNGAQVGTSARDMRRLSPSLSFSYRLSDGDHFYLRASYKNIFRAPTFNESYYFHYGSADLNPESTNQLNLGVTCIATPSPSSRLMLTLDGYYNHVSDKIVAVPYNMFIWRCVNVGKVTTLGAEATLQAEHRFNSRHQLTLRGTYSYQQSEDRTLPGSASYGMQLAYTPLHTGSASLCYDNPWVGMVLHGQGVSQRWANNEHYASTDVDGYWDTGLCFYRSFPWGRHRIEARFDVKNLFGTRYEIVRLYPMPSRSWQFTVNIQY